MNQTTLVQAAMGQIPFDVVVVNAQLVNVYTAEIHPATIGIKDKHIAYVATGHQELWTEKTIDAQGKYVVPGLVDGHMHIESTMATPASFAAGVLPHGTTAVAADPHEIANVLGVAGVKMMLESSRNLPLKVYIMAPSTVPSLPDMETSGAQISHENICELLDLEGVIGLGEVMDFWGVVNQDEKMTAIVEVARKRGSLIEGHSPVFTGKELQAFIAAGIDSDHTIMDVPKVEEKLRSGMNVQIQNRFITPELMHYVNNLPDSTQVLLVTDDVTPDKLCQHGHLDGLIRKAIRCGLDPIKAIQSTTIRTATRLRLYKHGGIGPGRVADMLFLNSLEEFEIDTVIADGEIVAKNGKLVIEIPQRAFHPDAYHSVKLAPLSPEDFHIQTTKEQGTAQVLAVVTNGKTSYTTTEAVQVPFAQHRLQLQDSDLFTMAVFERHGVKGSRNLGVLKGIGKLKGAVASTYSHDCHNLVVIGSNPADMAVAANALIACGGGLVAVEQGKVVALIELPIAGLMCTKSIDTLSDEMVRFAQTMLKMGVVHSEPVMILTILALAVSPTAKITDLGLVDVVNKQFLTLIQHEE